jgi:hypothetical protein
MAAALPERRYTFKVPARIGEKLAHPEGFGYTTPKPYCTKKKIARKACAVELVFKRGEPNLRLCHTKGKEGFLISVKSAREAAKVARDICACYDKKKRYELCVPKDYRNGKALRVGKTRKARGS